MNEPMEFIYKHEGDQRDVMLYFHHLLVEQLGLTDKIRFKIPFYYMRSWICYLNPTKDGKVELAFVRGNELSNEAGLLDNKGRKQVYGVEFENVSQIPDEVETVIQEAILLDESTPYQSKRRQKRI